MAAFRDIEEVSQGLLSLLGTNHAQAQQRRLLGRHEQILERLLEMQDDAEQRLRETLAVEEKVAQSLLDTKECMRQGGAKLQQLEAELQKAGEEDAILRARLRYVAQLYRRISKIEWDYECEPGAIRGIHHGPSVAQPVHLDSAQLSKQFVSDYLWSLLDTAW